MHVFVFLHFSSLTPLFPSASLFPLVKLRINPYFFQLPLVFFFFFLRVDFAVRLFILIKLRGAHDNFPDFFRIDTFIDSTHMKL